MLLPDVQWDEQAGRSETFLPLLFYLSAVVFCTRPVHQDVGLHFSARLLERLHFCFVSGHVIVIENERTPLFQLRLWRFERICTGINTSLPLKVPVQNFMHEKPVLPVKLCLVNSVRSKFQSFPLHTVLVHVWQTVVAH